MPGRLKVLVLEPYHGGSHRYFIDNLTKLPFRFEVMTLPARKWKWRMRLSAPYFAGELGKIKGRFDRIVCSTFLDVAVFRGMAPRWAREVPLLTYFHENQFAYPVQVEEERDLHFALTNVTSALASDGLAFNSGYNLKTFLSGARDLLRHSTDMKLDDRITTLREKSRVIPPGLDFSAIDAAKGPGAKGPPVVLWNHRWEYDKNPEPFFETLFGLDAAGADFSLVVLGQSFERKPAVFDEARKRLKHRILHFGHTKSRREYIKWLKRGDIAVSTSVHEFFGMAVLEAVRAGCRPLLPRRLSYPEMFPNRFLYEDSDFQRRLAEEISEGRRLPPREALRLTEPYSWDRVAPEFAKWITAAGLV